MKIWPLVVLLVGIITGSAGAAPSRVSWPGWLVESGEELSQGVTYSRDGEVPRYPLSRLFDGDAKTAWVYSATSREWDPYEFKSGYALRLTPDEPLTLDGLRVMNGQNLSAERFKRNHRVRQVRVTLKDGKRSWQRTFELKDRMWWQEISFPAQRVESVTLELLKIQKGDGPGADLCLSELELRSGGKRVNMHMPPVVVFYDGLEGCGAEYMITREGTWLDGAAAEPGSISEWSTDGRYIAGVAGEDDFWVIDARRAKVVRRVKHPEVTFEWQGKRRILVKTYDSNPDRFRRVIKL